MSNNRTRFWVNLAMLTAISLVVTYLSKMIPFAVVGFLKFDFKDVIIAIGGFLFGPLAAVAISVVASLIEMLTFSGTGIIGCIMNIISTVAFVCPAAYIYKLYPEKRHHRPCCRLPCRDRDDAALELPHHSSLHGDRA